MKRILSASLLLGASCLLLLTATPGPDHKVDWCHYPPGQWNGSPWPASKVNILSIDVAAEPGHLGHSPSLTGGTCNPASLNGTKADFCAEGVTTNGPAGCPGPTEQGCGTSWQCLSGFTPGTGVCSGGWSIVG